MASNGPLGCTGQRKYEERSAGILAIWNSERNEKYSSCLQNEKRCVALKVVMSHRKRDVSFCNLPKQSDPIQTCSVIKKLDLAVQVSKVLKKIQIIAYMF